jgi:integrase
MGVYKRKGSKNWYISYSIDGKQICESTGSPYKNDAERALRKRLGEIVDGKYEIRKAVSSPRFEDFAKEYLEYSKANKRSWTRDRTSIKNLLKQFRGYKLHGITPWLIEKYKRVRKESVTVSTVNRELACLKHMFTMAIKWGKANDNPVKEVKLFREPERRLRWLTEEECEMLINASTGHIRSIVITAVNTGMRLGEILILTWDRVDFERATITVERSKNDGIRHIPMNTRLTEELQSVKIETASNYVFPNRVGEPFKDIKNGFIAAQKRAGIERCRFHDLRHTFASHLVMNGADIATVKELMGHKTIAMTMRYAHLSKEHKQRAVDSLQFGEKKYCSITAVGEKKALKETPQLINA